MEFKIIGPGGDELRNYSERLASLYSLPFQRQVGFAATFGNMLFNHYDGGWFNIWYSNYCIEHDTMLTGLGDGPVFEMHIQFEGSFLNIWDGQDKWLKAYQYNLTYTPHVSNKAKFKGGRDYQTFDIHYDIKHLEKMRQWFPALDRFLKSVEKKQAVDLSPVDRYLSPQMIHVLHMLLNCPFSGPVANFYIESYVVILLLFALEQLSLEKPVPVKMDDHTIDRLYYVKDLVIKDFESPLSMTELCQKAAINEYALKKGFKYLFGTTVFDYMHQLRMEKAKQMLLETKLRIEEIAFMTGYETGKAFEKAFKKHFGFTPAYLRRSST